MNSLIVLLVCFAALTGSYGSGHFGCLRKPYLCDASYQYCEDDGFRGKCVTKQYSWLVDPQVNNEPFHPQAPVPAPSNDYLDLTPEKRHRLANIVLKVKRFLRSNNIQLSDLSNKEIDELAQAVAQVFLQQEEDLRAKEQLKLEAYLQKLGRDDLLTTEQLHFLEKEVLTDSGKSRDETHSGKSSRNTAVHNAQHQSDSPARKPMINRAPNRSNDATQHQNIDPVQEKLADDAVQPSEEDTIQVQARNDDNSVNSDIRTSNNEENKNAEAEKPATKSVSAQAADVEFEEKTQTKKHHSSKEATYIIVIVVLLVVVLCIVVIAVAIYCMKSAEARNKLLGASTTQSGEDYQALCRQHYASTSSEKGEAKKPLIPKASVTSAGRLFSPSGHYHPLFGKGSRNSSQSSWSEEPVTTTLDISTGHTVLAYMEDHLNNKDRLDKEWEALCAYKAENVATEAAQENSTRNRSQYAVPYDHNRVKLNAPESHTESNYINASYIIDNDPRWPVYIATQGPLSSTVHHFWQMIWEQGCVVIVMLAPLIEEGISQCARYWPDEGSSTYDDYEIHLVSEHIWCEDYLVRSLYLKNLNTGETRTVTQFHFLSWPADGVPSASKQLLELRRKVSKCYRGNAQSPIVVHCSDGCGRTGSYMLLDLVIARMVKGTCKEIDIAATLEHLRDQRAGRIVATKEQLEFVLSCVADEVNAILKVLLQ